MIVITVARKPLSEGTVAANTLSLGTGALNIDATRVAGGVPSVTGQGFRTGKYGGQIGQGETTLSGVPWAPATGGRWPANLILEHLAGCTCVGTKRVWANQSRAVGSGVGHENTPNKGIFQAGLGGKVKAATADADGMETVADWRCVDGCPVAEIDREARFFKQVGGRHEGGT